MNDRFSEVRKTYVVCSSQRSGSSLFCHLLRQTAVLGRPGELLVYEKLRDLTGSEDRDVLTEKAGNILKAMASDNGVSGVKFHFHQFSDFISHVDFKDVFVDPRWVFIDRRDIVLQAVSLAKARQDRVFSTDHAAQRNAVYDFTRIDKAGHFLAEEKAGWEWFFASIETEPVRVYYEDLLNDAQTEVKKVLELMQESSNKQISIERAKTKKQGGDLNLGWRKRFLSEFLELKLGGC